MADSVRKPETLPTDANLITDESLLDLDENDITEMGIMEMGPRKIILKVIAEKKNAENIETEASQLRGGMTIQQILAQEPRFQRTFQQLESGVTPDGNCVLAMNRILTKFYFERMIHIERRYPSWKEKEQLAKEIVNTYPQLKDLRVKADDPAESYFFWRNTGQKKGTHSGIIETRVGNMRSDVPSEDRLFQRPKLVPIIVPEEIIEIASHAAALTPSSQNIREISEKMAKCATLHHYLLQQKTKVTAIVKTFPHLLAYNGIMVQKAFEQLYPNARNEYDMESYLRFGLQQQPAAWKMIENVLIRGALRYMKKLTLCGIKRKADDDMTVDEFLASPLIRWIKVEGDSSHITAVESYMYAHPDLQPHLVCCADTFKNGKYYVVFSGCILPCGSEADVGIDVLLKIFPVFGIDVSVCLKKLYDLTAINVWGIDHRSSYTKVAEVTGFINEYRKPTSTENTAPSKNSTSP